MGRLSSDRRLRLTTERLRLEPLTAEHTELLVELDSDPEVLRFIFGRALSREEVVDTWAALLDHAFTTLGLPRVWAVTMAVNTGSRAVMARLGMRHVRTEVHAWDDPLPGWDQGEVFYEIERSAWLTP
ncbi:MAG: GNAT family N-acetyltransferase [Nocardioides sp.]